MTSRAYRKRNARLFSEALIEAFERKYREALEHAADAPFSERTAFAVDHRLARYHRYRRRKMSLIAAIIAAAMLLCGCAAYVYREQIADFLLEHTNFHINVSHSVGSADIPDPAPCYGLSYVPEGYELVKMKLRYADASCEWQNTEKKKILFSQHTMNSKSAVDNERIEKHTIEAGDKTILCFDIEQKLYCYMWTDGCFSFTLRTDERFSDEEIVRMVNSMTIIEHKSRL